ncbi:MAG: SLC13 family permease, partial [Persicimonas sp.]
WEPVPIDVTAMLVLVLLAILGPWTTVTPEQAVSGFSNPATLTVLAMLVLSEGVRRTGFVQSLAAKLSRLVGRSPRKHLAATLVAGGPISGFMNNTPVVALLTPVIDDMGHKGGVSPSHLLMPLSYVSMLGGMLTVIGTSTNLLAADLSERLIGRGIGMFEFAHLGVIVLLVGALYLYFASPKLLPARVEPHGDYVAEFALEPYLSQVYVPDDSPLVGKTVADWLDGTELQFEVLTLIRDDCIIEHPYADRAIEPGDVLLVHAEPHWLEGLDRIEGIQPAEKDARADVVSVGGGRISGLAEIIVPSGSRLEGDRVDEAGFPEHFDTYVLAIRRGPTIYRDRLGERRLEEGDNLLVQTTARGTERMRRSRDILVVGPHEDDDFRREKMPVALGIVAAVVLVAAFEILPIMISALAGVVAMMVAGVVRPFEAYRSIDWRVIFLLAGIIPLGIGLEQTGAAGMIGEWLAGVSRYLPAIVVLWLFYMATGFVTEVISNNASVLLMIPIAVETAHYIDANPFAFVLALTFAASTAFMGPVGYQTNLFVYGPGGYHVGDFARLGFFLRLLLSVVTVGGIVLFWGL